MTAALVIDGRPVVATPAMPVENPATEKHFAQASTCSAELLDDAVTAAARAFPGWRGLDASERAERLRRCGVALGEQIEQVARLLTAEQGKPLSRARAEVALSARWFADVAALRLDTEVLVDDAVDRIVLERVPIGVVAAVTPSNYPIILAACKVAPALLAGNTVVLKPSPDTPLSSLAAFSAMQAALPPGVLNVVCGDAELGRLLVAHPRVRKVSFTGSVPTGRAIAAAAGQDLRRTTLELGGNDPAVVLADADVEAVAAGIFGCAFDNAGQFCAAVKRVYVPRALCEPLTEALCDLASRVRVGDGADPDTDMGPLTTGRQLDRVAALVEQARHRGARVRTGGAPLDRIGHFYPPTIVTDLAAGSELETEEQFGPALPVISYDSLDEAVRRANDTSYGLGASVWGTDGRAVQAAARGLQAGTVWLNRHGDLRHDVPFGGIRSSGIGVEYGYWGLLEYTQVRVLNARVG